MILRTLASTRFCTTLGAFCLLSAALLTSPVQAQNPVNVNLLQGKMFSLSQPVKGGATLSALPVEELPDIAKNATGIRVTLTQTPDNYWKIQLGQNLATPVQDGQVLRLHFFARSSQNSRVAAVFEQTALPNSKALNAPFTLSPRWKEYALVFKTPACAANGSGVRFQLGFAPGVVDLADIRLEDYGVAPTLMPSEIGRDLYGGLPHTESWRAAANARIERYRKGNVLVHVLDAKTGKPIPNAQVTVTQRKHAFLWGTAVADRHLLAQTPDGEKFRATIDRLFNYVVLENALKWDFYGGKNTEIPTRMLDYFSARNIPVRGHNLLWPGYRWLPPYARNLRGPAMRAEIERHVRQYAALGKGRVVVWDAVNEAISNHDVTDEAGRDLLALTFKWAREVDPVVDLAYNENTIFNMAGGTSGINDAKIEELLNYLIVDQKAPVTTLGIQGHMGVPLVPADVLLRNLDVWGKYHLPIEITEYDLRLADDEAHSRYLDEFMTAIFSYPKVRSFVMWGFWGGAHWRGEDAALFRKNWTPRPAAKVYEKLVFENWWTTAAGASSKSGDYRTRAFLGVYEIAATADNRSARITVSVTKNQDDVTSVTMRL
ncbi:MAG: endo-1,4-beta-xylanase [Cytophagales bacterium]|nr:endo-1,4-beta-xylanase [Armatimonadota bacterium]